MCVVAPNVDDLTSAAKAAAAKSQAVVAAAKQTAANVAAMRPPKPAVLEQTVPATGTPAGGVR